MNSSLKRYGLAMGIRMKDKEKKSKRDSEHYDFSSVIRGKKLPLLILDEKWLQLFEIDKMPKDVKELQAKLTKLVIKQGGIIEEIAGLKRHKSQLLQEIVENMGIDDSAVGAMKARKMEKNQKLIAEIKEKLELNEEILDDLPEQMQRVNEELLIASSNICYSKLNEHVTAVKDLAEEINILNEQLMMKKIEKEEREESINRMYTYMHNMYGSGITEILDINNEKHG